MTPLIIDPMPSRRPLPIMQTIQDAAKLNIQERTTFYVSAYLSGCPDEAALVAYCTSTLSLRWSSDSKSPVVHSPGEGGNAANQKSLAIALRLLHGGEDGDDRTTTE